MPRFWVGGVAVAIGSLEQAYVAVADALHEAMPGGDVETAGATDRDAAEVDSGLLAARYDGADQIAGGEPLDLLGPG